MSMPVTEPPAPTVTRALADCPTPVFVVKSTVYNPATEYPEPPLVKLPATITPFTNPVVPYPTEVGAVTIPIALDEDPVTAIPVLKL